MEGPDSLNQLPLPVLPVADGARTIQLPQTTRHSKTFLGQQQFSGATPVPNSAKNGPDVAKTGSVTSLRKSVATLWYAAYFPQLSTCPEPQQQKLLNALAALALQISATVSFHPLALVCEIRSSLNYFGGIDAIHDKLKQEVSQLLTDSGLPDNFLYAASPTVTGSLLLARSGHNALVYQKDNLRSALGQLPTSVLELNKEQNRRLYNMGVRYLRDIWRLPGDGLRKRFGSEFINLLNKALGSAPEPTRNYLPPPAFTTCYDLPFEVENLDRLLPVTDEMLAQLCDFLRRRDLSTSQLSFSLLHEKRSCTSVSIGLRQPSRSREHLLMLLETHFSNLNIPAPVIAVKLDVKKFDAFMSHSDSLSLAGKTVSTAYSDTHLNQFIEQLQARFGDHHIKSIASVAEHCPEYACEQLDYIESYTPEQNHFGNSHTIAANPRPFWLLTDPVQLTVKNGKLYHRKAITIMQGPERIETRWWSDQDVRRDYYVAQEGNGSRLWIYRERYGDYNWYLHGFFA